MARKPPSAAGVGNAANALPSSSLARTASGPGTPGIARNALGEAPEPPELLRHGVKRHHGARGGERRGTAAPRRTSRGSEAALNPAAAASRAIAAGSIAPDGQSDARAAAAEREREQERPRPVAPERTHEKREESDERGDARHGLPRVSAETARAGPTIAGGGSAPDVRPPEARTPPGRAYSARPETGHSNGGPGPL